MRKSIPRKPSALSAYVRQQRERAGLSQRQLAAEAGVSVSNISRLESGFHATPTPELLKHIADVLDVDFADLLASRGIDMPAGAARFKAYLRHERGLPEEGIEEVESAIEQIAAKYWRQDRPPPET